MYYTKDKLKLPPHEVEQAAVVSAYNFSKLDKAKKYMLSFSAGKDSMLLLELALANGFAPEVWHQYIVDGLSFNEEIFAHYRARGIEINQIEGGIAQKMKKGDMLCINKVFGMVANNQNPMGKTEELLQDMVQFDLNLIGIKVNDSPQRRLTVNKNGWLQESAKKAYPIYNWSDKQVWAYLYDHAMPVNRAYEMFGRSMDVINWDSINPLRTFSAPDYHRFIHTFPLIEALAWAKDGYAGDFAFSDNAKAGSVYNYGQDLDRYLILAFDDSQKKRGYSMAIYDDPQPEDEGLVYLEGKDYRLAPAEWVYEPPATEVFDESTLDGSKKRFQARAAEANSLDYFIIFCFKTVEEKQDWCRANNIQPNVHAVSGERYTIEDAL